MPSAFPMASSCRVDPSTHCFYHDEPEVNHPVHPSLLTDVQAAASLHKEHDHLLPVLLDLTLQLLPLDLLICGWLPLFKGAPKVSLVRWEIEE
jgi:hypothetical protein